MALGERDDHERGSVAAGELLTVLAVDRVADPLPCRAVHHHLGEEAEVARRRQRDVLERYGDPLALPRGVAVSQRGRHRQGRIHTACDIPRGQYVVDRSSEVGGSGHHRESEAGVDGVIHARASVGPPRHLDVNQVGSQRGERVVGMPFAPGHIRDQHPGVGDQPLHEMLALGGPEVGGDGPFALVQPGPVDAGALLGDRPAEVVGGAADRIDPHHLRTELTERHAGQRHRDEAGDLDDPHSGQRSRGTRGISHRLKLSSATPARLQPASLTAGGLDRLLGQQHLECRVAERDEAVGAGDPVHARRCSRVRAAWR